MILARFLALSLAALTAAAPASAQEAAAPAATIDVPAATGNADLTVYGNNFAMVRERRQFHMAGAAAQLVLGGISRELQPETAFLQVLKGDAVTVTEQTFNFDLLSPSKLLERAVGTEVGVVTVNPATGRETTERARLLSINEGVVLEIGGKVHTNHPGRIVFDSVPPGARARPALLMNVLGKGAQDVEAELSYLTGGLSWRPDYIVQYDADAGRMSLQAWATITNTTGMDFRDARLKLVAGDVNRVTPPQPGPVPMGMKADAAMAATARAEAYVPNVTPATSLATHVYTVARATTLGAFESKQLGLLSGRGIVVRRQYTARAEPHFFTNPMRQPFPETRARVELTFKNDAAAKLGVPLPAGVVRVYGQDSQGAPQFLGEDRIDHTAVGGDVSLSLGTDFDIGVLREQLTYARAADNISISGWRVTLTNAKSRPVTVRVIEPLPGAWEIIKESHPHTQPNAGSALWSIEVPAKGKTVLEYNVRVTF